MLYSTATTGVSRGNYDRIVAHSHVQSGLSGEPCSRHRAGVRRRLSEPPGTLADRLRPGWPDRYRGAHHEPVAVGPFWPAVHRGEPHRLRWQYRRRRSDQFATGRLYAVVRWVQQRDLDLALQEAAV